MFHEIKAKNNSKKCFIFLNKKPCLSLRGVRNLSRCCIWNSRYDVVDRYLSFIWESIVLEVTKLSMFSFGYLQTANKEAIDRKNKSVNENKLPYKAACNTNQLRSILWDSFAIFGYSLQNNFPIDLMIA